MSSSLAYSNCLSFPLPEGCNICESFRVEPRSEVCDREGREFKEHLLRSSCWVRSAFERIWVEQMEPYDCLGSRETTWLIVVKCKVGHSHH